MMEETREGPTPNGGVKSTIYYYDAKDNPTNKEDASKAVIVEYDSTGKAVARTYANFPKRSK